jgi:cobalamin biosynthetic protein CobC
LLEHGGRLRRAAQQYGIPLSDWQDLSTGINPNGWPVPAIPAVCWQRLPEDDDGLLASARDYYGNNSLLAVAGSQAAIQTLPILRSTSRVGVLHPAYAEHASCWRKAGHILSSLPADADSITAAIDSLEVLILINPNNPSGSLWKPAQLLAWQQRLAERGGWLIVDEAFLDGMPEFSLAAMPVRPGLVVLRSVGKFFGLAGIRCGFVIAEASLLQQLAEHLGPWAISHPSRYVATLALQDADWQRRAILDLQQQSQRLRQLMSDAGLPPSGGCHLFQWLQWPSAQTLHSKLATQGILTRYFDDPSSLRFGLPKAEADWQRLQQALS